LQLAAAQDKLFLLAERQFDLYEPLLPPAKRSYPGSTRRPGS
jgi:hypothetical protein